MIADHIGIISNGKLGYEGEVHKDADLERIFMEVVCPGEKSGMQNIVFRPIRFNKIWLGKTAALVILLFVTNLFLWIATTVVGMAASVTVSPLDGLIGCMLLFLTYLWQIPVIMQLACFMGYMKAVFVSLAANIYPSGMFFRQRTE